MQSEIWHDFKTSQQQVRKKKEMCLHLVLSSLGRNLNPAEVQLNIAYSAGKKTNGKINKQVTGEKTNVS